MALKDYEATYINSNGKKFSQILRKHRNMDTAKRYAKSLYGKGNKYNVKFISIKLYKD